MKKCILFFVFIFSISAFAAEWASDYQSMIAFQKNVNREGYVKPIATYMGTILNGSWLSTASVERRLAFEAGMPFQIALIESGDREYHSSVYGDVPTIFGSKADLGLGGNEDLHGISVFTLPYLQLGVSFFYTRLVFRGMYFPSVSEFQGYHLLSFGVQHSFGHFFREKLPPILRCFDVSLFFGYNSAYIGYTPDKWKGKLDLDFGTTYTAIVFGFKPLNLVEVMLSLGYQTSTMDADGSLDAYAKDGTYQGKVNPDVSVDGRGVFRLGLEVAFAFGESFHPVVGYNVGANNSFNANVIYFKKSFNIGNEPEKKSEKNEDEKEVKSEENSAPKNSAETENSAEISSENSSDENSLESDSSAP
ncbi:MAG: DUF6588 family protein [Hallerella porci]|uniref:MetA-pathway of phenol degradation n=1 Tax=Hallerella porci TaxID=1945871 RepID=A0ABX5LRP4_9BACT|nr:MULTISPECIES: DUF6588 family protein [Hallerella]MCI5601244.1 hypothetical protein [Hallerella sp.]MDY3922681.1 DUF6588 family protein [Hallerella porci]PWL01959.1 hypothetical protein B0H50_10948 [Hallerella porci]